MSDQWHGYFAAAPTPFTKHGDLDLPQLKDVVAWLLAEGAHGIVVNGTTGEWAAQTSEERKAVLETARDTVPRETPLLVGVSSIRPTESVELAHHAAEAGADGVLLTIPPSRWLTDDEIVAFYAELAARCTLPVVVYNVPVVVGYDLPCDLLARLMDIDGVVGVKDNTPSPERRAQTLGSLGSRHAIFSDVLEASTFPVFAEEGFGRGQIGSGMPLGRRMPGAFELVREGRIDEAWSIVTDLAAFKTDVLSLLGPGMPWHAQIKTIMLASGVDAGYPRFPATTMRDDTTVLRRFRELVDRYTR